MARATIYLPDAVHQRWRDEMGYINLSKLATSALLNLLNETGEEEVVHLCDMCQRRVGLPIRNGGAPSNGRSA
jgi:hypothetical protein